MTLAKGHVSCLSSFSKGFSSETTGPISFKFHMQPSSKGGEKVYIFCPGHMTKMATMPIYGKNLNKSSVAVMLCDMQSRLIAVPLN